MVISWNFGDNTTPTIGQNTTHTFTTAGTYTVILTVTDKDGAITTQTQTLSVTAPPSTTTGGIRSGGKVTLSGSANLDGNVNIRTDDTKIYAAMGVTLNGNITLPVKPGLVNGKKVLLDGGITTAPGAVNSSSYTNYATATQTITIPTYNDIKQQSFTVVATPVIYDISLKPINSASDWNSKFPIAGTSSNPTVVRVVNGNFNLPPNINLSNYVIIVENGNINLSQGNPVLNNVMLIANNGNINFNSVNATNLRLSASGNINFTGNTLLAGISTVNSNGNTTLSGNTQMTATSLVKVVAGGDVSVSGNSTLRGQFLTRKSLSMSGSTSLVGSIDALGDVSISGNSTITAG